MQQCKYFKMLNIYFNPRCLVKALTATLLFFTACEDSEKDSKMLPPCQTFNFGVLEVRFSGNEAHRTTVTYGGQTREKISAMGLAVDTLRLTPGLYSIFINPIMTQQGPIVYLEDTITITQCADSIIIAPF
jgi:hypothetical protein